MARNFPGCPFERYADDAIVHCTTRRQAQYVLSRIAQRMGEVGLTLHPEKTRIVYCKDGRRREEHEHTSFSFLGYAFRGRGRAAGGRIFNGFLPAISPEALKAKGVELRRMRINRRTDLSLDDLARWLNPIVFGWINYYGWFYRSALDPLLKRVNVYLRRWAWTRSRTSSFVRIRVIFAEDQLLGDLAVAHPAREQAEHFEFSPCELIDSARARDRCTAGGELFDEAAGDCGGE